MSELVIEGSVLARARVNVALIKYWGKAPGRGPEDVNLPAVPSLSLTLDALFSDTEVAFAPELDRDEATLDGAPLSGEPLERVRTLLDRVRSLAGVAASFRVASSNHVPTAAGLASSASGMAALAAASARCAGLNTDDLDSLSAIARVGSGSAARSVHGGWVAWEGAEARQVAPPEHWPLAVVVAIVQRSAKAVGSRAGMLRTAATSPYYGAWVHQARATFDRALTALESRDLEALIDAMELSTARMHAAALASDPPLLYWAPASLAVVERVRELRSDGLICGWTMDAGPNVKVVCPEHVADDVKEAVAGLPGVQKVLNCRPGRGVEIRMTKAGGA